MLRSALELRGYRISALDGEIGKARDFLFDDERWVVRYLVADTGNWLSGRRVLLSPAALGSPDWAQRAFPVDLTREQIENSPPLSSDEPVSRQAEQEVVNYYDWPLYWTPPALEPGPLATGVAPAVPPPAAKELRGDPHLRSMREVEGYHIHAKDGTIGHVAEFIVDDEAWSVRYIVVDTRNWLPGRKVLLAPNWFVRIDWSDSQVYTELTRTAIKQSPTYDPAQPVNRDYEGRLYDYYGRPGYWTDIAAPMGSWKI